MIDSPGAFFNQFLNLQRQAVRPKNSILENRRLKEASVNVMVPWQDDVVQYIEQFGKQLLQNLAV